MYIDGRDAGLTQNEFKLVALLGRYAGRVLTYDYLIREIWGPNKAYDNQILLREHGEYPPENRKEPRRTGIHLY